MVKNRCKQDVNHNDKWMFYIHNNICIYISSIIIIVIGFNVVNLYAFDKKTGNKCNKYENKKHQLFYIICDDILCINAVS